MSYVVDYHIHSYYSDGTMSPVELVRKYKDAEYDIIAITDHDGIDGVKEATIAGEAVKLKVLTGVELSTEHCFGAADGEAVRRAAAGSPAAVCGNAETRTGSGTAEERTGCADTAVAEVADCAAAPSSELCVGLHILGYDFDAENEALNAKLAELKRFRHERNEKLCAVLSGMGYPVELAELEKKSKGGYVGKPNIARALVEGGYIEKLSDAWAEGKLFESEQVKAIRKEKLPAEEAVRLISEVGGMAVLAHPAKIRGMGERGSDEFWKNMNILLRDLKKLGLKGVECYHPDHSEDEAWRLFEIAAKYHLHITEGSDFHGEEK